MKKILKIMIPMILILIIFLVVLFGVTKDKYKIELKQNEFIYELGEEVSSDVSTYLKDANTTKNIKQYSLSSDSLDIKDNKFIKGNMDFIPVGEYKVKVSNNKEDKDFIIKVSDSIAPEFTSSKDVIEIEETNEDIDLKSYFETKDYSVVELSIEGEYDLNKIGEYSLKIVAKDESNNTSEKEFMLKVTKKVVPTSQHQSSPKSNSNSNSSNSGNNNVQVNSQSSQPVSSDGYKYDVATAYVNQVNAYRKANGLSELPVTAEAQTEANRRAKELVTYYSHDGAGYGFGEIIGHGSVGGDFMTAWKNSPPHNAAMLREGNTAIAASVYEHNNHWYAVISFRMNY